MHIKVEIVNSLLKPKKVSFGVCVGGEGKKQHVGRVFSRGLNWAEKACVRYIHEVSVGFHSRGGSKAPTAMVPTNQSSETGEDAQCYGGYRKNTNM